MANFELPSDSKKFRLATALCLLVCLLCSLVVIGWWLDITVLKNWWPGTITMKLDAATSMALCSLALILCLQPATNNTCRCIVVFCGLISLILCVSNISNQIIFLYRTIDQLQVAIQINNGNSLFTHRMAASTAFCLLILAISLIWIGLGVAKKFHSSALATSGTMLLIVSILAILGYVSNMLFAVELWEPAGMSIPAAVGLLCLGLALLLLVLSRYHSVWALDLLTTSVFCFGIAVLISIAAYASHVIIQWQNRTKAIVKQQNILIETNEIMRGVFLLQDGQRGYLIAGDESLIEDRQQLLRNLQQDLSELNGLIQNDSSMQFDMNHLRELINQQHAWQEKTIIALKKNGLNYSQHLAEDELGLRLTSNIEAILNKILNQSGNQVSKMQLITAFTQGNIYSLLPIQLFFSMTILIFGLFIHNRMTYERKIIDAQHRQSQKLESIGMITTGVAHDLNNILAVLVGNLELLQREQFDSTRANKHIDAMQRAISRCEDLTKRLLGFSRSQSLNPSAANIVNSINNVVSMAEHVVGKKIKIILKIQPEIPKVLIDVASFENALLNLIVNSRDAMPTGGSIIIIAHTTYLTVADLHHLNPLAKPGEYVNIVVRDTGRGMTMETLNRAFEPFFTTKPEGIGTGLGLSTVYTFVEQALGIIKLTSAVDQGTTVSIYLPIIHG